MVKHDDNIPDIDESEPTNEEDVFDEDLEYTSSGDSREAVKDLNAIDRIFNTEAYLYHIKMTMLGYRVEDGKYKNTGEGLATTQAINKMINSLRGVIATENMLSFKTDPEINFILLENAKEVVFTIYDDPTVDERDVEHVVNMVDHPAEMFMGIVKSGDGSEAARQILTGNYLRLNDKNDEYNPAFRLGTANYDWLTVGGKRNEK